MGGVENRVFLVLRHSSLFAVIEGQNDGCGEGYSNKESDSHERVNKHEIWTLALVLVSGLAGVTHI